MLLKISHKTQYNYDGPVQYGLQELRLCPRSGQGQTVRDWQIEVEGGVKQAKFLDQHENDVWLVSFERDVREVIVNCVGEVETEDTSGLYGPHRGCAPLWYFQQSTSLSQPGASLGQLIRQMKTLDMEPVALLHHLSATILERVAYKTGMTTPEHSAEVAYAAGHGVCQDHSHIFIAAARALGFPARYVSGYLMLDAQVHQEASHAWAEAHVDGLGWVGFDISNGISPDARYVRLATGLDYLDAAPISGIRIGRDANESLTVDIQVAQ